MARFLRTPVGEQKLLPQPLPTSPGEGQDTAAMKKRHDGKKLATRFAITPSVANEARKPAAAHHPFPAITQRTNAQQADKPIGRIHRSEPRRLCMIVTLLLCPMRSPRENGTSRGENGTSPILVIYQYPFPFHSSPHQVNISPRMAFPFAGRAFAPSTGHCTAGDRKSIQLRMQFSVDLTVPRSGRCKRRPFSLSAPPRLRVNPFLPPHHPPPQATTPHWPNFRSTPWYTVGCPVLESARPCPCAFEVCPS